MFNVRPVIGFNVSAPVTPGFRVNASRDPGAFRSDEAAPLSWKGNPYIFGDLLTPYGLDLPPKEPPFSPASTDDYCREVVRNCNAKCLDRYELLGGQLGPVWWRRCVRDCVAPTGCSY